jgi:hypothetical protein
MACAPRAAWPSAFCPKSFLVSMAADSRSPAWLRVAWIQSAPPTGTGVQAYQCHNADWLRATNSTGEGRRPSLPPWPVPEQLVATQLKGRLSADKDALDIMAAYRARHRGGLDIMDALAAAIGPVDYHPPSTRDQGN